MVMVVQANSESGLAAVNSIKLRVGVAAGRTVGSAVKRNRAKRLLRAAMQTFITEVAPGWDLILIARPALSTSNLNETRQALMSLLRRSKLISPYNAA
jgi:ribonuclease P protein component